MEKIIFPIKTELEIFENKLKKVIASCDNFLMQDLEKFMFQKAKRLRPILVFLFAKILKIESPFVQDIALIIELVHSASLIHDDIIDEEEKRRNNPTFYKKYGSKLAVLEGDLLLSLALEKISTTTLEISKIFANRIKKTIQGEIEQNQYRENIDLDLYYKKTYNKTANLFLAGLEALFSLGNKNEYLYNFLKNYALAFQIKNDIDNFITTKTDLKNGNHTLPMIYFLMENKSFEISSSGIIFDKFIQKSLDKVENLKNEAIDNLLNIESSIYKNSLIELTNHSLRS